MSDKRKILFQELLIAVSLLWLLVLPAIGIFLSPKIIFEPGFDLSTSQATHIIVFVSLIGIFLSATYAAKSLAPWLISFIVLLLVSTFRGETFIRSFPQVAVPDTRSAFKSHLSLVIFLNSIPLYLYLVDKIPSAAKMSNAIIRLYNCFLIIGVLLERSGNYSAESIQYYVVQHYTVTDLARSVGFVGHPNLLGALILLSWPSWLSIDKCHTRFMSLIKTIMIGLSLFLACSTYSRSVIIGGSLQLLLIGALQYQRKIYLAALFTGVLSLAAAFVMLQDLSQRLTSTFSFNAPSVANRLQIWYMATELFKHDPLLGLGCGVFPGLYSLIYQMPGTEWSYWNAHSFVVDFLLRVGGLGLAFAALLLRLWDVKAVGRLCPFVLVSIIGILPSIITDNHVTSLPFLVLSFWLTCIWITQIWDSSLRPNISPYIRIVIMGIVFLLYITDGLAFRRFRISPENLFRNRIKTLLKKTEGNTSVYFKDYKTNRSISFQPQTRFQALGFDTLILLNRYCAAPIETPVSVADIPNAVLMYRNLNAPYDILTTQGQLLSLSDSVLSHDSYAAHLELRNKLAKQNFSSRLCKTLENQLPNLMDSEIPYFTATVETFPPKGINCCYITVSEASEVVYGLFSRTDALGDVAKNSLANNNQSWGIRRHLQGKKGAYSYATSSYLLKHESLIISEDDSAWIVTIMHQGDIPRLGVDQQIFKTMGVIGHAFYNYQKRMIPSKSQSYESLSQNLY